MTKLFTLILLLLSFTGLFFTKPVETIKPAQINSVFDCSPKFDYKTDLEEQTYCQLQKENPNCEILEDLSIYCK